MNVIQAGNETTYTWSNSSGANTRKFSALTQLPFWADGKRTLKVNVANPSAITALTGQLYRAEYFGGFVRYAKVGGTFAVPAHPDNDNPDQTNFRPVCEVLYTAIGPGETYVVMLRNDTALGGSDGFSAISKLTLVSG